MKVLFDHQTFTLQNYGGISRYYYELFRRFEGNADADAEVSLLLSNNAYLNKNTCTGISNFFPKLNFKGKYRIQNGINQFNSVSKLKARNYDVFHPTYYHPYFLPYLKGKPFVVTFLDMIHEKFNDKYSELKQDTKIYDNKKLLLKESSKVIAISESTKNDIIEIFNVNPEKIEVIYLGNSMLLDANGSKINRVVNDDYILYVGNRSLYKNFSFYLSSVAEIIRQKRIKLICAGGGEFNSEEILLISELKLSELVEYISIDDSILSNLYANALGFAFPSLYEGFGIPVLEAFACKCPVMLSKQGSLPEVGGDAAIYFDPENKEEIRNALLTLIENPIYREELISKGNKRLQKFSWDRTFEETANLYQQIL
ncbi:glycosyltransferase family 4 protein [Pedobacter alluvionis]|uniref:Glycosyltransferase family 1 protein n=1 Tax=Pedobacter alluvionis TaxID=475253 RepID=A0A497XVW7_9SPHI|nr:glycosyltransferase family 1 protein [Pedobacter alluvionis]RLJ73893.1 glycosyltransferase involved in cell wall biosynthesis [Pedobacter alluvionis]TFB32500.1 glycosyltransferase family 1 protein [Pedobacter alluvionis]